ncbi:MAG: hypothetical protein ACE5F1_04315 [Planctomycetota bacterium]
MRMRRAAMAFCLLGAAPGLARAQSAASSRVWVARIRLVTEVAERIEASARKLVAKESELPAGFDLLRGALGLLGETRQDFEEYYDAATAGQPRSVLAEAVQLYRREIEVRKLLREASLAQLGEDAESRKKTAGEIVRLFRSCFARVGKSDLQRSRLVEPPLVLDYLEELARAESASLIEECALVCKEYDKDFRKDHKKRFTGIWAKAATLSWEPGQAPLGSILALLDRFDPEALEEGRRAAVEKRFARLFAGVLGSVRARSSPYDMQGLYRLAQGLVRNRALSRTRVQEIFNEQVSKPGRGRFFRLVFEPRALGDGAERHFQKRAQSNTLELVWRDFHESESSVRVRIGSTAGGWRDLPSLAETGLKFYYLRRGDQYRIRVADAKRVPLTIPVPETGGKRVDVRLCTRMPAGYVYLQDPIHARRWLVSTEPLSQRRLAFELFQKKRNDAAFELFQKRWKLDGRTVARFGGNWSDFLLEHGDRIGTGPAVLDTAEARLWIQFAGTASVPLLPASLEPLLRELRGPEERGKLLTDAGVAKENGNKYLVLDVVDLENH